MNSLLRPGQTFTGTHLIYTTLTDDGALGFCDSEGRHARLCEIPANHAGLRVPDNLLDPEGWLIEFSAARWSVEAIRAFKRAPNAAAADVAWCATAEYLGRYFAGSPDVIALCATYVLSTYLFAVADRYPFDETRR